MWHRPDAPESPRAPHGGGRRFTASALAVALLAFMLASCGFSPLYEAPEAGGGNAVVRHFNDIAIAVIPERNGQILRNLLIDRLYSSERAAARGASRLETRLRTDITTLGVDEDATSSRSRVEITADFTLHAFDAAHDFSARTVTSFNTTESDYATFVAEREAVKRGLAAVADDMALQLAAFFRHHVP